MKNYLLLICFLAFAKLADAQCSVSAQVVSNVTCYGACDGVAAVTLVTGTPPFTYQWIPAPSTSATASGLCPGPYAVMITDSTGCQASSSLAVISQPGPFNISVTQTSGQCFGDPGCWDVIVSGATPPYSYMWSNGDTVASLCNVVSQGSYIGTIYDANGCDTTIVIDFQWPQQMFVNMTGGNNLLCYGDSSGCVELTATGGVPPYFYNSTQLADSDTMICGLAAGSYNFVIVDSVGCSASAGVSVAEPLPLSIAVCGQANIECYGDSTGCAAVCVNGGTTPYFYSWSPVGGNGITACNLIAGNYTATVTDGNGCTITATAVITEPTQLIAMVSASDASCSVCGDGSAYVTAIGGTGPYTYIWNTSPIQMTPTATGLQPGVYTCCVWDANGCTACASDSVSYPVSISGDNEISSAVSVYPNPSHSSAFIIIEEHLAMNEAELTVYDVIGNEVQRTVLRSRKTEIRNLSAGIYWLKVSINNKSVVKKLIAY
jgi:large repetitive protein